MFAAPSPGAALHRTPQRLEGTQRGKPCGENVRPVRAPGLKPRWQPNGGSRMGQGNSWWSAAECRCSRRREEADRRPRREPPPPMVGRVCPQRAVSRPHRPRRAEDRRALPPAAAVSDVRRRTPPHQPRSACQRKVVSAYRRRPAGEFSGRLAPSWYGRRDAARTRRRDACGTMLPPARRPVRLLTSAATRDPYFAACSSAPSTMPGVSTSGSTMGASAALRGYTTTSGTPARPKRFNSAAITGFSRV